MRHRVQPKSQVKPREETTEVKGQKPLQTEETNHQKGVGTTPQKGEEKQAEKMETGDRKTPELTQVRTGNTTIATQSPPHITPAETDTMTSVIGTERERPSGTRRKMENPKKMSMEKEPRLNTLSGR